MAQLQHRVRDGIASLIQQLEDRVKLVEDGYEYCLERNCSKGTAAYEDWSTPSRDKRLGELFKQVSSLVESKT